MRSFDVAVVGGGIFGACAAYHLARRGRKVVLIDQYEIPNSWAASSDHALVFRCSYGKDTFYTDLAMRALGLWKDFQKDAKEELYQPVGALDIAVKDKGYEEDCYQSLKSVGLPVFKWDPKETHERYRIFNPRSLRFSVYHPDGGLLWAQRAVAAYAAAAARHGVRRVEKTKVNAVLRRKADGITGLRDSNGKVWEAGAYVFAAGPWTREMLSAYGLPLKVTRQELLYLRPPNNQGRYRPAHCPPFSVRAKGFYGLPVHIHGFMKIGDARAGKPGKPGPGSQGLSPSFERACRAFLKKTIPDLASFSETEGKIGFHDRTPDGDFIVDRLPDANGFVAAGFSDHGFKFGPLIGKTLAELIIDGKTEINLQRFRLGRFRLKIR